MYNAYNVYQRLAKSIQILDMVWIIVNNQIFFLLYIQFEAIRMPVISPNIINDIHSIKISGPFY